MAQKFASGKHRLALDVCKHCKYGIGDRPVSTPKKTKTSSAKYGNGEIVAIVQSRKIDFALEEKNRVVREAIKRSKSLKSNKKRSSEVTKRSNDKRRKVLIMQKTL